MWREERGRKWEVWGAGEFQGAGGDEYHRHYFEERFLISAAKKKFKEQMKSHQRITITASVNLLWQKAKAGIHDMMFILNLNCTRFNMHHMGVKWYLIK